MPFFSFLAKIPWRSIITKTPDIINAVNKIRGAEKQEPPAGSTLEENFLALEKLAIEQSKLIAALSDRMQEMNNEIANLKKEISLLFSLSMAMASGIVVLIVGIALLYHGK